MVDVFEILDLGMGLSVQDEGRVGWLRYERSDGFLCGRMGESLTR